MIKEYSCKCGATAKGSTNRLPAGWKRTDPSFVCKKCWNDSMVLRAIASPVVEIMDGTWEEFREAIHQMWAATTQATNWAMTELYARDIRRSGQDKLPPMSPIYLYPELRTKFPQLPSQAVAALERMVQAKYRAKRFDLIWRNATSLPTYRYPSPFSLPNQAWSVRFCDDRPLLSARIGDRRWELRLKSGPRYHRQIKALQEIACGKATQGSLDFYQQRIDEKPAIMAKVVAYLPRYKTGATSGAMLVRVIPGAMFRAMDPKGEKVWWTYNADHVPRWIAEHKQRLERWSDDQKLEARPDSPLSQRRVRDAEKYRDRMRSAVQQAAAHVSEYARRRRYALVEYDDRYREWLPDFPWAALRERIKLKLSESGVSFRYITEEQEEEEINAETA
jgi:hypothetical protein